MLELSIRPPIQPPTGSPARANDAEHRIAFANAGAVKYFYDALNKRIWEGTCNSQLPNNYEVGRVYAVLNACANIDELYNLVDSYNSGSMVTCDFYAIGGYNSNSFSYTFLSQIGLLNYFGTPGGPQARAF
jgi:hypothetical protein